MIYLINVTYYDKETKEVIDLLKIGFTDNWEKRKAQYQLHNPIFKNIHLIENGTEEQESKLHYKFREKRYNGYGDEWYYYDKEIVNFIKSITLEELDKLPNNPVRGDQKVLKGKRKARFILSYLFNTKEEIENYLSSLSNILGDSISFNTSLDYIKSDPSINQDKLNYFLEVNNNRETGNYSEDKELSQEVATFFRQYESLNTIHDKLQMLCEYDLSDQARDIVLGQIPDSDEVKSYYTSLSPDRLKALSYNSHKIKKELKIVTFSPELLINTIYSNFNVGDKLLLSEIKDKLSDLYKSINYTKTPKASDLLIYFNINSYTSTVIIGGKKKRAVGYELISSNEYTVRDKLKAMKS